MSWYIHRAGTRKGSEQQIESRETLWFLIHTAVTPKTIHFHTWNTHYYHTNWSEKWLRILNTEVLQRGTRVFATRSSLLWDQDTNTCPESGRERETVCDHHGKLQATPQLNHQSCHQTIAQFASNDINSLSSMAEKGKFNKTWGDYKSKITGHRRKNTEQAEGHLENSTFPLYWSPSNWDKTCQCFKPTFASTVSHHGKES